MLRKNKPRKPAALFDKEKEQYLPAIKGKGGWRRLPALGYRNSRGAALYAAKKFLDEEKLRRYPAKTKPVANEKDLQGNLQKVVKAYARRNGVGHDFDPIENVINNGTFDCYFAAGGRSAWVELKVAGPDAAPRVRNGQPGFGIRKLYAGIPAVVLVGTLHSTSYRLLRGDCEGPDWKELLICRGRYLDTDMIETILSFSMDVTE